MVVFSVPSIVMIVENMSAFEKVFFCLAAAFVALLLILVGMDRRRRSQFRMKVEGRVALVTGAGAGIGRQGARPSAISADWAFEQNGIVHHSKAFPCRLFRFPGASLWCYLPLVFPQAIMP